jgi:hypothetical protein
MSQENKEIKISFRLTEDEGDLLNQLAKREGIDPSKYLRNIIKNQERAFTLSPDEVALLKSNFANITRLGSNINQITYHMNSKALSGEEKIVGEKEKTELENLLKNTDKELIQVKRQIIDLIKKAE